MLWWQHPAVGSRARFPVLGIIFLVCDMIKQILFAVHGFSISTFEET